MRISSSLIFQTGLGQINRQQADLLQLYKQAGSGQRLTSPADDPLAAARAINLAQSLSVNQRLAENRALLNQGLSAQENALTSVTLQLQDIKTRLVEAANGTLSDADRRTLSEVLLNAKDTLFNLANSTDGNGLYLFSGHAGSRPAFVYDNNQQASYAGDAGQRLIQADTSRQIAAADNGHFIFASAPAGSVAYITTASGINQGTAIMGAPQVTDNAGSYVGKAFQVDFISVAGSVHYQVHVLDAAGQVVFTDGPHPPPADAQALHLPGGVQVALSGQAQAGDQFLVTPAYSDGSSADINLFQTLDTLAAQLASPVAASPAAKAALHNALNTAMQKIDLNYNQVLTVRASTGSRMAELDAIDASGRLQALGFRAELSRLEDVDYFEVSTQLQLRQSALEAAAMAFKRVQASSLLNTRG